MVHAVDLPTDPSQATAEPSLEPAAPRARLDVMVGRLLLAVEGRLGHGRRERQVDDVTDSSSRGAVDLICVLGTELRAAQDLASEAPGFLVEVTASLLVRSEDAGSH